MPGQPPALQPSPIPWRGLLLAALLAVPAPLAAVGPPREAGAASAAAPVVSLAQAARFRRPEKEELSQFYGEFRRKGWRNAIIPSLPTEYGGESAAPGSTESRMATLWGDADDDGEPEWIVGGYFSDEGPSIVYPAGAPGAAPGRPAPPDPGPQDQDDDRARIVIFKKDAAGLWRVHWRSPGLGYEFKAPTYNLWEVRNRLDIADSLRPPLSLVDIDGDGCLEVCYHCWSRSETVGGLPGVYRYDGGRWVSVAPQADRFSLRDLDGDRRLEVITGSPYVGFGTGDDDVPRVWRWNGRQYQEASSEFPRYYKELAARYDAYIRRMEARREEFKKPVWERALQKAVSLAG